MDKTNNAINCCTCRTKHDRFQNKANCWYFTLCRKLLVDNFDIYYFFQKNLSNDTNKLIYNLYFDMIIHKIAKKLLTDFFGKNNVKEHPRKNEAYETELKVTIYMPAIDNIFEYHANHFPSGLTVRKEPNRLKAKSKAYKGLLYLCDREGFMKVSYEESTKYPKLKKNESDNAKWKCNWNHT